jgi:hypothetical protein
MASRNTGSFSDPKPFLGGTSCSCGHSTSANPVPGTCTGLGMNLEYRPSEYRPSAIEYGCIWHSKSMSYHLVQNFS